MNIYSCLLALLLACNVTAEIIYKGVEEKQHVTLPCPHSVEGKVTWSREINGRKEDILAIDGDRDQRFNDPQKRYSSLPDKSLLIFRLSVSDSETYYCNNEPAAVLTVIPSGTQILQTTERSSITLTCPHDDGGSHVPTWSREIGGKQKPIRLHVSTVTKTLMSRRLRLTDSGLYLCDGKPAVYLNVIKEEKRKPTTTTTSTMITTTVRTPTRRQTATVTTTTIPTTKKPKRKTSTTLPATTSTASPTTTSTTSPTTTSTASPTTTSTASPTTTSTASPTTASTATAPSVDPDQFTRNLVLGIVIPFVVLIIIITCCTWRRRIKRRGTEEEYAVYEEIQDGELQLKNRESNQNDPTYHTIPDLPPMGNKTDSSFNCESSYPMITNPLPDGNKQGESNQNDPTYYTIADLPPRGNMIDTFLTNESPYSLITS